MKGRVLVSKTLLLFWLRRREGDGRDDAALKKLCVSMFQVPAYCRPFRALDPIRPITLSCLLCSTI
jgi:hypothetical protein